MGDGIQMPAGMPRPPITRLSDISSDGLELWGSAICGTLHQADRAEKGELSPCDLSVTMGQLHAAAKKFLEMIQEEQRWRALPVSY